MKTHRMERYKNKDERESCENNVDVETPTPGRVQAYCNCDYWSSGNERKGGYEE